MTPPRRRLVPLLVATLLALAVALLLRTILASIGETAAAALFNWPRDRLLVGALKATLATLALPFCLYAWHRLARDASVAIPIILVLGYFTIRYLDTLSDRDQFVFAPGIVTLKPQSDVKDDNPNRPQFPYRTNHLGFREPDWSREKPANTLRGVIIGDSYVFGSGVPFDETLSRHLQDELDQKYPKRSIQVINLGLPGYNFASYVDMYQAAQRELNPDFVVLCLTMPNDLSNWDMPHEWRAAHRVSLYSAGRYLLGASVASALWGTLLLEKDVRPSAVAEFNAAAERLASIRAAGGNVPMVVFAYRFEGPPLTAAFARAPGATLLDGQGVDTDFIPGDGHPNAQGNRRFAPIIAAALDALPAFHAAISR